jgi:hypothetical protein
VKKLLGEKDVEAILQRLDRLSLDEARMTAAQSLEAIYGLVQNMRMLMDGEQLLLCLSLTHHLHVVQSRWQSNSRRCKRGSWYVLSDFDDLVLSLTVR